jgi:hypothetical protein
MRVKSLETGSYDIDRVFCDDLFLESFIIHNEIEIFYDTVQTVDNHKVRIIKGKGMMGFTEIEWHEFSICKQTH